MQPRLKEVWRDPGRLALVVVGLLVAAYLVRSCIPGLQRGQVPSALYEMLQTRYVRCVTDTPVWPGEPRQPECGELRVRVAGEGTIGAQQRADGLSRAVCLRVTYTNPYWTTMGQTRHEIAESTRSASKVALLQHGTWQIGPDEDSSDRQSWQDYACPGAYDTSGSGG